MNKCQKELLKLINYPILESNNSQIKFMLNESSKINSPQDVKDFIKKNDDKIQNAATKMKGKKKNLFIKAYDFIIYACNKGMKFIGDHWISIMKLMAIIIVGILSYKLYDLAWPQIEKLFNHREGEIHKARQATSQLNAYGDSLQTTVNDLNQTVDNASTGNTEVQPEINMKQRMINKAFDDYKVAPQGKDLNAHLKSVISQIKTDPLTARKYASGSGNISLLR